MEIKPDVVAVNVENWIEATMVIDLTRVNNDPIHLARAGAKFYLIDGHHRLLRALYTKAETIDAVVTQDCETWKNLSVLLQAFLDPTDFAFISPTTFLKINIIEEKQNETN